MRERKREREPEMDIPTTAGDVHIKQGESAHTRMHLHLAMESVKGKKNGRKNSQSVGAK
jgi:hypothetical protein